MEMETLPPSQTMYKHFAILLASATGALASKEELWSTGALDNPTCPFCEAAIGTRTHMIWDCPYFAHLRPQELMEMIPSPHELPPPIRDYGLAFAMAADPDAPFWMHHCAEPYPNSQLLPQYGHMPHPKPAWLRTVMVAPNLPMAFNVAHERGPFPDPQRHLHAIARTDVAPLAPNIYIQTAQHSTCPNLC